MTESGEKIRLIDNRYYIDDRYYRNIHHDVNRHRLWFIIAICTTSFIALATFVTMDWDGLYKDFINIPPKLTVIPEWYFNRSHGIVHDNIINTNNNMENEINNALPVGSDESTDVQMNKIATNPLEETQINQISSNPYGEIQINKVSTNPYGETQINKVSTNPYGETQINKVSINPYGETQINKIKNGSYGEIQINKVIPFSNKEIHINRIIHPHINKNIEIHNDQEQNHHEIVDQDRMKKLVCYYASPNTNNENNNLFPKNIDPRLCTHLNIGIVSIINSKLYINDQLERLINETRLLKRENPNIKLLLWIGGADSKGFPEMVINHDHRKLFLQSLRDTLKGYHLDGVDLDWEFPSAYRRERQHFSQLLHEIRKEFERERRDYLLSIAVAAPEGIAFFAYDIREINKYVNYVNIMTYDFHFYSKGSPFTGLNAPLYSRHNEHSLLGTLNINYTVNYWLSHGLDRNKIIVGLPTYGHTFRDNYNWLRLCIFIAICATSSITVYSTWNAIYRQSLNIPPKFADIPVRYYNRAEVYSEKFYKSKPYSRDKFSSNNKRSDFLYNNNSQQQEQQQQIVYRQIDNERIYPSKYGNFIYKNRQDTGFKLICYYEAPITITNNNNNNKTSTTTTTTTTKNLYLTNIDPYLCTHLNIGIINVVRNNLYIDERIERIFQETKILKQKNKNLKILLWVGDDGGGGGINIKKGFSEMIAKSGNRKMFVNSLKSVLENYCLDGIDIDWERSRDYYYKDRQHFSQLLHEIRREYQRDHRTYLLSVAIAALPESIISYDYDIIEINSYVDYVNVLTFDYNFYGNIGLTITGVNAPLYSQKRKESFDDILNINYTVNLLLSLGLNKRKIIVGLSTYGHSYKLVNPFNHDIGSPSEGYGRVGTYGFASYSEICWFKQNNIYVTSVYDNETCSPYLYASTEWISYEDERSLECKTKYIKSNGFGGAMIFSLNTDDYGSHCVINKYDIDKNQNNATTVMNSSFPLVRKIYSILFDEGNK